jgi:hypothetical protein
MKIRHWIFGVSVLYVAAFWVPNPFSREEKALGQAVTKGVVGGAMGVASDAGGYFKRKFFENYRAPSDNRASVKEAVDEMEKAVSRLSKSIAQAD